MFVDGGGKIRKLEVVPTEHQFWSTTTYQWTLDGVRLDFRDYNSTITACSAATRHVRRKRIET
jgi:hypothetical protein